MSTEGTDEVYCSRCRRRVPTEELTLRLPEASSGMPDDYGPDHVHVYKHRRCKELIFMPGRASVERRRHLT